MLYAGAMKRLGWVVFALACGQKSPPALPVKAPPPIAEDKPAPPPDAAVVDAGPDLDAVKAQAAADAAKKIADRHDRCLAHAAENAADLPKLPPPSKRKPTAAVALVEVAQVEERYNKDHGFPAEGWWNGTSVRKKLEAKASIFTSCYADALKRNPDLSGGITIGATLQESGALDTPHVIDDLVGDSVLQSCVLDKFAKLKIPGGSKDAFGFEAYFDLAFCPPERGACLVVLQAPDVVKSQIKLAVEEQLDRVGACYKAAGKRHARGLIYRTQHVDTAGDPMGSQGLVLEFTGDDKKMTAFQQASDCDESAWSLICLEPRSDVYSDAQGYSDDDDNAIKVHTWMQR
jgi:hypothetical protein